MAAVELPDDDLRAFRDALANAQAAYERASRALEFAARERNEAAKVIRECLDELEHRLFPRGGRS